MFGVVEADAADRIDVVRRAEPAADLHHAGFRPKCRVRCNIGRNEETTAQSERLGDRCQRIRVESGNVVVAMLPYALQHRSRGIERRRIRIGRVDEPLGAVERRAVERVVAFVDQRSEMHLAHGQRQPRRGIVLAYEVPVDPAVLAVLHVVVEDERIDGVHQLEVADVRE